MFYDQNGTIVSHVEYSSTWFSGYNMVVLPNNVKLFIEFELWTYHTSISDFLINSELYNPLPAMYEYIFGEKYDIDSFHEAQRIGRLLKLDDLNVNRKYAKKAVINEMQSQYIFYENMDFYAELSNYRLFVNSKNKDVMAHCCLDKSNCNNSVVVIDIDEYTTLYECQCCGSIYDSYFDLLTGRIAAVSYDDYVMKYLAVRPNNLKTATFNLITSNIVVNENIIELVDESLNNNYNVNVAIKFNDKFGD